MGGIGSVVVVGAGQAGEQVASSLRADGFAGTVTLVGDEPGLPYQRPPLSKGYAKDGDAERLLLRTAAFYERSGIAVLPETRVARIDREGRAVEAEDGRRLGYDHLVLATGARNFRPPALAVPHPDVVDLRTLADAAALRARLPATRHAVVIGGGFIGLEFASVARAAGVAVTVVEAVDRLMARVVSPAISARFLAAHEAAGTRIVFGARAIGVATGVPGAGVEVALDTGETVAADFALVATGVVPNVEIAADAGLSTGNGILVDAMLATSDPAISAVGDCAAFPGPDGAPMRLESVQAAVDHGRHVARRIAQGVAEPYAAVPWFWSDQGALKLQIAGLGAGADEHVVMPGTGAAEVVIAFRGGLLAAVETVNAPGPHMAARRLLARGDVTADAVRAAGFDLRALAKAGP